MKKAMQRILRAFTHNIALKLMALFVALVIWLVVVSIDNPVKDQNFSQIPVSVVNAEVLEREGKAYELAETSKYVTATVRAERSVLSQLSKDDFSATIDMNNYSDGKVPIQIKANRLSDRIAGITPRTPYALVKVEELETKQFYVDYEITGEPAEGYSTGDVTMAANVVRAQGAQSLVNLIDKAVVRVSVQGMTRDMKTESSIIFIDHNGDEMDVSGLELSRTSVGVTVEIWEDKEISVAYSFTGTPAEGFAATGKLTATINTITVGGAPETLAQIGSVSIPAAEIDITGATENVTKTIDVAAYLPHGVSPADRDEDTSSVVTVEIIAMNLMNIEVPISNITLDNVPEGYTAQIGGGTVVVTSVRGLSDVLASVTGAMLTGRADLSGIVPAEGEPSVHDVDVTFAYPEGIYGSGVATTVKVLLTPEGTQAETEEGAAE